MFKSRKELPLAANVSSLNGETGAITLTSTGGSILVTTPTSTTINLETSSGGTVTSVSVASSNGFAGTSSGGTTPALTLSTTITGVLKGNGTAISAASAGTDYQAPISLTTTGNVGASTFSSNVLNIPVPPIYQARVATSLSVNATYSNGSSGVGATLTNADTQAALSIDGITMAVNDVVVITNQSSSFQNGIYTVTNIGSGSTNWVLTRASYFDNSAGGKIVQGAVATVSQGTANAGITYIQTALPPFTMGTTPITFIQNSAGYTFSTGLTNAANTITSNLSTGVSGGQSVIGGKAASESLTLSSTSHSTKGNIVLGSSSYAENLNQLNLVQSVGGSATTSALNLTPTWNTSGAPTAMFLNVTNTASSASSRLIDLQVGGASKFSVDVTGVVKAALGATFGGTLATTGSFNVNAVSPTAGNFNVSSATSSIANASAGYGLNGGAFLTHYRSAFGGSSSPVGVANNYAAVIVTSTPTATANSGIHDIFANLAVKAIGTITNNGATVTKAISFYIDGAPTGATNNWASYINSGNSYTAGKTVFDSTITTPGTTGNQTINKPSGTVNIAAAGTTVTVTNSFVTASSIVLCVIRTNDTTATIKNVVPSSGSFVITLGAATTAEISIGFIVYN